MKIAIIPALGKSDLFDKIIVSTDSQEISDIPFIRLVKNNLDFPSIANILL